MSDMRQAIEAVFDYKIRMEKRVAELEQDSKRLDWLESTSDLGQVLLEVDRYHNTKRVQVLAIDFKDTISLGETLRQAIDKAMAKA